MHAIQSIRTEHNAILCEGSSEKLQFEESLVSVMRSDFGQAAGHCNKTEWFGWLMSQSTRLPIPQFPSF